MAKELVICSEKYWNFDFGRFHPMRPFRVKLAYQLMKDMGLLDGVVVEEPYEASWDELKSFHREDYLLALKEEVFRPEFGLGTSDNPVVPGIYSYAALAVGGTLKAVREVLNGGFAFNLGGGMHHAHERRASGFCYLNDVVIGIKALLEKGRRVFYLDIDAHHCDAVQDAFYDTDEVFVFSLHQEGIFPGTGRTDEIGEGRGEGFTANINLPKYAEDEDVLYIFENLVIPLIERFSPNVLFLQAGADGHKDDPLTSLYLTTGIYAKIAEMLRALDLSSVVVTGGGGYDIVNVARIWSIIWAGLIGKDLPDMLPDSFLRISIMEGYDGPGIWDIPGWSGVSGHVKDIVREQVEYLRRRCLE